MKKFLIVILLVSPCLSERKKITIKEKRSLKKFRGNTDEFILGPPYQFSNSQSFELVYGNSFQQPINAPAEANAGYAYNQVEYGSLNGVNSLPIQYTDQYSGNVVGYLPIQQPEVSSIPLQAITLQAAQPSQLNYPAVQPQPASDVKPVSEQIPGETVQPLPAKATLPARPSSVGSGSLGVVSLGNGFFSVGSGSLGYAAPQAQQRNTQPTAQGLNIQIATVNVPQQNVQIPQATVDSQAARIVSSQNAFDYNNVIPQTFFNNQANNAALTVPSGQATRSIFPVKTSENYVAQQPAPPQNTAAASGNYGFGIPLGYK